MSAGWFWHPGSDWGSPKWQRGKVTPSHFGLPLPRTLLTWNSRSCYQNRENQDFLLGSGGWKRSGRPWTTAVALVLHTRSATPAPAQWVIC